MIFFYGDNRVFDEVKREHSIRSYCCEHKDLRTLRGQSILICQHGQSLLRTRSCHQWFETFVRMSSLMKPKCLHHPLEDRWCTRCTPRMPGLKFWREKTFLQKVVPTGRRCHQNPNQGLQGGFSLLLLSFDGSLETMNSLNVASFVWRIGLCLAMTWPHILEHAPSLLPCQCYWNKDNVPGSHPWDLCTRRNTRVDPLPYRSILWHRWCLFVFENHVV